VISPLSKRKLVVVTLNLKGNPIDEFACIPSKSNISIAIDDSIDLSTKFFLRSKNIVESAKTAKSRDINSTNLVFKPSNILTTERGIAIAASSANMVDPATVYRTVLIMISAPI